MIPVGDRILVKPIPAEEKNKSGLPLSKVDKEKPLRGEIVAVGATKKLTVKVGDIILYNRHSGDKYNHEGVNYLIMREDDILELL